MTVNFETVVASAPGKVILFGEHAVVYGVTAIAAALSDLRIFVEISSTPEEAIEVQLHDVIVPSDGTSFTHKIQFSKMRELFCESLTADVLSPVNPDETILEKLRIVFEGAPVAAAQGMMAIVYLIAKIVPESLWPKVDSGVSYGGMKLSVKSEGLPIGAGLGSSAAFSVALSAALLRLKQQQQPFLAQGVSTAKIMSSKDLPTTVCHTATEVESIESFRACQKSDQMQIPLSLLPVINGWAYAAEVVIHGSPSGLDNTTR